MAVRKAETRIPLGFVADDLGQTAATADGKATLVSYYQSPVAQGHKQNYVVIVTDTTWQSQVVTYRWQVLGTNVDTTEGVWEYTPGAITEIDLNVTLKRADGTDLGTVSLQQTVVSPNEDLENLIARSNTTHPVAAAPAVSREVINDYLGLIHAVAPVSSHEILNRILFGISYVEAQANNQAARETLLATLRGLVEGGSTQAANFLTQATPGAGICGIRPEMFTLLAIVIPRVTTMFTITPAPAISFPADAATVTRWLGEINTALVAAADPVRIDLFNMLRFPRLSLKCTQLMIEGLQASQFSGHTLSAIFGVQSDILSLIDKYKTGPHS
jgi:hypothetical protein